MSQGGPSELRGAQRAAFVAGAARRAFSLDPIADLSQVPELFDGRAESYYVAPALLRADVVLHAVGIYEPPSDGSAVAVTLRADAGRTVLLLSAYQATSWDVRVEPGASLAGIYLVGREPCEVRCGEPLRGVVPLTDVPIVHCFDTRRVDDEGARNFLCVVRERTQRPLATFQGAYHGSEFVIPPYRDAALVDRVVAAHAALVREFTHRPPAPFWLVDDGEIVRVGAREEAIPVPRDLRAATLCDVDGRFYGVDDHNLFAIGRDGAVESFRPPREASWLGGVAYDSKRRRLIVTTRWHVGTHHAFDPVSHTWTALATVADTTSIDAITYDPALDVLLAMVHGIIGGFQLASLTPDLAPIRSAPHTQRLPLPPHEGPTRMVLQLAALPDAVALCVDAGEDGRRDPQRGFLISHDADRIGILDLGLTPKTRAELSVAEPEARRDDEPIYVSELRRDAAGIVGRVVQTQKPITITAGARWAVLSEYTVYQGLLATVSETTTADWMTKLERARRELREGAEAASPISRRHSAHLRLGPAVQWTPQAAEDAVALGAKFDTGQMEHIGIILAAAGLPMDGPFAGLCVAELPNATRAIFERRDPALWIAYLRHHPSPPGAGETGNDDDV